MIKLYGVFPSRTNRPMWALEELGIPYTFYNLDFAGGQHRSDAFLKLNPGGKIPVIDDGGFVLCESGAICSYLGDHYSKNGLTPKPGTRERALYDQWMIFVQSELEQPMWTKAKHKFALPKEHRISGINPTTEWEFQQAVSVLSAGLGDREYILGDRFTMADIMITHTLGWAKIAGYEIKQDNVIAYSKRNNARPAVKRMAEKEKLPFDSSVELAK